MYGFKAIASTRAFLATLESRSIIINMTQGIPANILIEENKAVLLRSELIYFRYTTLGKLKLSQPVSTSGASYGNVDSSLYGSSDFQGT